MTAVRLVDTSFPYYGDDYDGVDYDGVGIKFVGIKEIILSVAQSVELQMLLEINNKKLFAKSGDGVK